MALQFTNSYLHVQAALSTHHIISTALFWSLEDFSLPDPEPSERGTATTCIVMAAEGLLREVLTPS